MMKQKNLLPLLLLLGVCCSTASAKGWKGIEPLRSTCEDVKRALKVDQCASPMSVYNLPEFRVVIFFSEARNCKKPRGWRVPPGTVLSLTVSPTREMLPSEMGIDLTNYKKLGDRDLVGAEGYESSEEGISVELFNGFVQDIFFGPTIMDEKLRCKPLKTGATTSRRRPSGRWSSAERAIPFICT